MVESNDIARVISAHKAFANWLTEGLHWIHRSEQIVHIFLQCFSFSFKTTV
jgi:hypothetical protein